ncbi:MAG: hypothetical protein FWB74_05860 [Defluviitaleaceae bacterium]|nr:hypothetical protein [Defluviitaleaceae bacterium]
MKKILLTVLLLLLTACGGDNCAADKAYLAYSAFIRYVDIIYGYEDRGFELSLNHELRGLYRGADASSIAAVRAVASREGGVVDYLIHTHIRLENYAGYEAFDQEMRVITYPDGNQIQYLSFAEDGQTINTEHITTLDDRFFGMFFIPPLMLVPSIERDVILRATSRTDGGFDFVLGEGAFEISDAVRRILQGVNIYGTMLKNADGAVYRVIFSWKYQEYNAFFEIVLH